MSRFIAKLGLTTFLAVGAVRAIGEVFVLPTPNRAIFTPGGEPDYFVPTPGRTWQSGTYGCVRSDGHQLHEGLDIKCTKRDKRGEPTDPVYAAAAGRVVYMNHSPGLSNYGRYMIVQHDIEGMPIFTTYAHLSEFADGIKTGGEVRQGQTIATMGRTSNTQQAISKDRAHLHFEICLRLNDRFAAWHDSALKGQRNDHGNWNGKNFVGLDPWLVLKQQQKPGSKFSLLESIRSQTELCRILVRDTRFKFLRDYTPLIRRNPVADKEGVAGYEIALNCYGVPYLLIPRAKSEMNSGLTLQLISVNEREQQANPCKKLLSKQSGSWRLTATGQQLIDLLRF